jgi:MFS family permease
VLSHSAPSPIMCCMLEQHKTDTALTSQDITVNRIAFFLDYVFFGAGLTFAGTATTLPAFAARLTTNPVWIGWISVIWSGGWLIPQIFAANYLAPLPRKMPVALALSWIGRPVFAALSVFLLLGGVRYPELALLVLLAAIFCFTFTDSVVAVAWFDMLVKALPGRERGRLIGLGQIGSGVLSIGAGLVVRWVLEAPAISFPNNYAYLFLFADVCFLLSLGGFYLIREPVESSHGKRQRWREYLPGLMQILRDDASFRRVTISRLLIGFTSVASPFFIIFALRKAGVTEGDVGIFTAVQTLGVTAAGLLFGWMADRFGPHRVIRVVGGVYLLSPLLALGTNLWLSQSQVMTIWFSIIFFLLGLGDGAIMLGFINYVLDIAPPNQRPAYIGLANTLMGVTVAYPLLGGWLAEWAGFNAVFILAGVGILAGWVAGWGLPDPRNSTKSSVSG